MRINVFKNGFTSELIRGVLPWDNTTALPDFVHSKAEYQQFHSHTKDAVCWHFSGFEGVNASIKVGVGNEAYKVNCLVVDYDCKKLTPEELTKGIKRLSTEHPPTAWNLTFSGGAHVVWVFEKPVFYHSTETWKVFVEKLAKKLKIRSAFPGIDEALLTKPDQTFVAGVDWTATNNQISAATLAVLEFDASAKANDIGSRNDIEIPFDVLWAEVEKKFPGRWSGPFQEGARGIRFFAPEADNPTGALIRKNGVTCFTGMRPFMSWTDIFGHPFVNQYRESRIGAVLSSVFADASQSKYWVKSPSGVWRDLTTDDTKRHIKSKYQISDAVPRGRMTSELDDILDQLKMSRYVHGALPFPHRPEETVEWAGQRFVNTAEAKLVRPAAEPGEFSWIKNAIEVLLPDQMNREHFLAWLKVWYTSCLDGYPRRGQSIFIVGPVGTGKSLLCIQVIGRMLGGHHDVKPFVVDGEGFNSEAFNKCVWCIDDAKAVDRRVHSQFSERIKAIVANPTLPYDKKFGYKGDCPFTGRTLITANDDATSLSILPDTGSSLLDKVNFYRTGAAKIEVAKDERERYTTIDRELPFFCRWLIDTPNAAWIEEDHRFGIKSHHDLSLLQDARANSDDHHVMEVIDTWRLMQIAQWRTSTTGEKITKPYQPWGFKRSGAEFTQILNTAHELKGMLPKQLYRGTLGKIVAKAIDTGDYPWIATKCTSAGTMFLLREMMPTEQAV